MNTGKSRFAFELDSSDRVIDGIDQSALLLQGDGHSRRDYLHVYTGDILAASIKQQFKRTWIGDRPGLMGDSFTDLYKDPREEHLKMAPYLWAWAAFDHMRAGVPLLEGPHYIAGAGHFAMQEAPGPVNELILEFLERQALRRAMPRHRGPEQQQLAERAAAASA